MSLQSMSSFDSVRAPEEEKDWFTYYIVSNPAINQDGNGRRYVKGGVEVTGSKRKATAYGGGSFVFKLARSALVGRNANGNLITTGNTYIMSESL